MRATLLFDMTDTEKKYTTAYGKLRRLTSTIDGQIRQISVSSSTKKFFEHINSLWMDAIAIACLNFQEKFKGIFREFMRVPLRNAGKGRDLVECRLCLPPKSLEASNQELSTKTDPTGLCHFLTVLTVTFTDIHGRNPWKSFRSDIPECFWITEPTSFRDRLTCNWCKIMWQDRGSKRSFEKRTKKKRLMFSISYL